MQYKNTLEAIYIQLNEVQQDISNWNDENAIRDIDLDLNLSKLRDIYDLLLNLKKENIVSAPPKDLDKIAQKIISEESEIKEIELDVTNTQADAPEVEIEKKVSEPAQERNEKIKTQIINDESVLSEKFSNSRPTLNEELSTQVSSADLANQLKNRPITNLSSAIGLNEKFELINSLFNGNKEEYELTIEKLNMATNFNEAYNHLNAKLQWDMSDPLVQRLLDLIRRKLIVNKNE